MTGRAWIDNLPDELAGQKAIMHALIGECEADERIRWLAIGCSLGRGAADWLSDLDMALGIRDDDFDAALPDIRAVGGRLADMVDSYHHRLPDVSGPHERIFVQYANRCQLDVVVFPASVQIGRAPNMVVLYDPDARIDAEAERPTVTAELIREWAFHGWCALADLGKYLRRRSPWEALARLNEARAELWRLWAVVLGVPEAQYGLTSILDYAPGKLPAAMAATISDLDPARLLAAARSVASFLSEIGDQLPASSRAALPDAMAQYVTGDLAELATARLADELSA